MISLNKIFCQTALLISISISTAYAGTINAECPDLKEGQTYKDFDKIGNWELNISSGTVTIPKGFAWGQTSVLYVGKTVPRNIKLACWGSIDGQGIMAENDIDEPGPKVVCNTSNMKFVCTY